MKSTCRYCNIERIFLRTIDRDTDGKIDQVGYWSKGTPFCEATGSVEERTGPYLICDIKNEKKCGLYEPKDEKP